MSIVDMEWGFRACEKGMNLEMARSEYRKLTMRNGPAPGVYELYNGGQHLVIPTAYMLRKAAQAPTHETGYRYFTIGRKRYVQVP